MLELCNGNLSYVVVEEPISVDTTLTIINNDLLRTMSGEVAVMELLKMSFGSIEGSVLDLVTLVRLIDKNNQYYDMVPIPTK